MISEDIAMKSEVFVKWIEAAENWLAPTLRVSLDTAAIAVRLGGLFVVLALAWLANLIVKGIILRGVRHAVKKTNTKWDDALMERRMFTRLSHLAPAVVLYATAPIVFAGFESAINTMRLVSTVYMVLVGLFVVDAFLNAVIDIYRTYEFSRRLPIRGFVQIVKIMIFFAAGVIVFSVIVDRDPSKLLTGMGAMTAVLMLIFKDSILGFVAGIQLSTNKMVHMGDWIEMPKYGADGDVIDISLTTVKVQNWDMTISTIPAYALISDSFKNWQGMSRSGGRRIKRAVYIDMSSIRFCDEAMLEKFKRFGHINEYIENKRTEVAEWNRDQEIDDSELVNGRRLTNIGTFRAYLVSYLRQHPKINKNMTFLVRQLDPTSKGLAIEIYVFSSDKVWANYEDIQSDIFDHVLAAIPYFGLRVFQEPTGADFQRGFDKQKKLFEEEVE